MTPPPNPPAALSGAANAIVSGTSRRFHAPELAGALSIKAVLSGSAIWETGRRTYVVRENSYLVVNQRQPYSFTIDSSGLSTTFSVFFKDGFVEDVHRVLTQPAARLLDAPAPGPPAGSLVFRQRLEPEPSEVLALLRRLNDARARVSRTGTEEAFMTIAHALVAEFPRTDAAAARLPAVRAATRDELLRRVLRGRDYLLCRIAEPVTVAGAARAACISPYHFFRSFRAAFGETPHQFLTRQRLARARTLLAGGRHTVTNVCFDSGFQSVASFSALFRRHFGVSPRAARDGRITAVLGARTEG